MRMHLVRTAVKGESPHAMDPVICRYCGERVEVGALDLPLGFREDPATGFTPRQFVIMGRSWLLHRCVIPEEVEGSLETPRSSAVVHQAQGMVSAQAECTLERALELMTDTAEAADVTVEQLAVDIVERKVRFDPLR